MMSCYAWNAEDYQNNSAAQFAWAQTLIEKLLLAGSETVLDLGCGDGKVTAQIARRLPGGSVLGIDNAQTMIDLASRTYPRQFHPNLAFALMDAQVLAFAGEFDVVFSNAVLHWVKDHRPVLAGLHKSLKPGGKILLQMGAKDGVREYLSVLEGIIAAPEWAGYFLDFEFPYGFMGVGDYAAMLPMAGFQACRIELVAKDAVHEDKEKFKGWIRTTWLPYTGRVPESKRQAFVEQIAASYLEQMPADVDGRVHVPMLRLEVEAVKMP